MKNNGPAGSLILLFIVLLLAFPPRPASAGGGKAKARKIVLMANLSAVEASSELTDPLSSPFAFSRWNAVDERNERAWIPDESTNGIGEWLRLRFLTPVEIRSVSILGACLMSGKRLAGRYHRVKEVSIEMDGGEKVRAILKDAPAPQLVEIGGRLSGQLRIVIQDVYPGVGRPLLCIAEVAVYGKNHSEGIPLPPDVTPLLANDIDLAFREGFKTRPAELAGPRLKRALSGLLVKYRRLDRMELVTRVMAYKLTHLVSPADGVEPCRQALRAAYDLDPLARRYVRERYFLKNRKIGLLEACRAGREAIYPLLAGRPESIPLFWKKGEYYGLLEMGDTRAAGPFLESFAGRKLTDRWWDSLAESTPSSTARPSNCSLSPPTTPSGWRWKVWRKRPVPEPTSGTACNGSSPGCHEPAFFNFLQKSAI